MDNIQNINIQYMVHNFRTESVVFRGSEEECLQYIKDNDSREFPLELYWVSKGDKHYKENENKFDEDEIEFW